MTPCWMEVKNLQIKQYPRCCRDLTEHARSRPRLNGIQSREGGKGHVLWHAA
jgi:hypothetical protein